MKLAVLQPPYPSEATVESARRCLAWMEEALGKLEKGLDLILLPEYGTTPGIEDPRSIEKFAVGEGKTFLGRLSKYARISNTWLAVGTLVEDEGKWFNRTVLFDRSGGQWFSYDKVHLTEVESNHLGLCSGTSVGLTRMDGVTVGVATCFDAYFPEYFSALSRQSVDLILSPSYQRSESPDRLRCMSQTRAIDCDSWFVRSSYAVEGSNTGGHTMIVAPDGTIVADAGQEPGVITATIDPKQKFVKPRSHGQPDIEHGQLMARHRRPDIYGMGE